MHPIEEYKMLWLTWSQLLAVGLLMLWVGSLALPRALVVPIMLLGMSLMGWLIASRFMHLRNEKASLAITVIGTTLFCGIALFVLIAFDGMRVFALSPR